MSSLEIKLPYPALHIITTLEKNGYEAYIVGGAVRDYLLNPEAFTNPAVDFDFTTNAKPEEIKALFEGSFYENTFGTVMVPVTEVLEILELPTSLAEIPVSLTSDRLIDLANAGKIHDSLEAPEAIPEKSTKQLPHFEITTFRTDGTYQDHRRPETVSWGSTLQEDLERRDFTINALAMKLSENNSIAIPSNSANYSDLAVPVNVEVIDHHNGMEDIKNHHIKTVGDANRRFEEDALRMLRAIRFSVQLNAEIEPATFQAITRQANLLTHISWERIRDEMLKILASQYPAEGIELLDETGLLSHILPELIDAKGVEQGGHHTTDVWTHSLDALRECPSNDPIVRLATLLHDIAKPETFKRQNGTITFYNHEVVGAHLAKKIARRWKLSSQQVNHIFILVRYHMFYYQPENSDASIRRFMRQVGLENIDDILDLREADRLGSGAKKTSWRLEEMKQRMVEQLHQPLDVTDLAISGTDLLKTYQLQPGPIIGQILNQLFEKVMDNPELNSKETLLAEAKNLLP